MASAGETGWRRARGEPPLVDVFRTVRVGGGGSRLRRALAFVGPGYLVAVGYMDPGNWATSIAGGAQFGYAAGAAGEDENAQPPSLHELVFLA